MGELLEKAFAKKEKDAVKVSNKFEAIHEGTEEAASVTGPLGSGNGSAHPAEELAAGDLRDEHAKRQTGKTKPAVRMSQRMCEVANKGQWEPIDARVATTSTTPTTSSASPTPHKLRPVSPLHGPRSTAG